MSGFTYGSVAPRIGAVKAGPGTQPKAGAGIVSKVRGVSGVTAPAVKPSAPTVRMR